VDSETRLQREVVQLRVELERTKRAFWNTQIQLAQILIEQSLAIEQSLSGNLAAGEENGQTLSGVREAA